jgi:hypothetical protein
MEFKTTLISLQNAISSAIKNNVNLNQEPDKEKAIYDYKTKQVIYYYDSLKTKLKLVKSNSLELLQLNKQDIKNQPIINQILELIPELDSKDLAKLDKTTKQITTLTNQLIFPKIEPEDQFQTPNNIPEEIKSDVKADVEELSKCFNSECYRSATILCGRLLETALHRKYYETTNNDLLEKSPGIGLGNIISKLKDKQVSIDPTLTNQIHLINQVRIFSVHKKKEAFYPTKQQAQATILYTLDILERLFNQ